MAILDEATIAILSVNTTNRKFDRNFHSSLISLTTPKGTMGMKGNRNGFANQAVSVQYTPQIPMLI
jgi:hypothetical protein